ncbi:MAG: carbohydrate ABC transporter permease [Acidobacteriota bacterium]
MKIKIIVFYFLLILSLLYCLGPYLWQFFTSFKPDHELTSIPPIFPKTPTFSHYRAVFKEHPFFRIILNSFIVATATTLLCLIIGSLASYSIAKLKIRGKIIILSIFLSISMFPPIATVSPLYIIIRFLGLRDTWWALILTYTTFAMPLTIWILSNFFKEIPDDLLKAAKVDGCTSFTTFIKIILPLSGPGIFTTAILVFIFSWNEFLYALTFTNTESSRTIPVGIALFPGLHEIPWGDIAAASITVTIPLIMLTLLFQKRIVEGLTAGAIKG